jgi:hypothetical protein
VGEQGVTAPLSAVALGGAGKVAGAVGEVAAEVAGKAGKAAAQVADHAPPLVKVAKKPKRKGSPGAASPAQAVSAGTTRGGPGPVRQPPPPTTKAPAPALAEEPAQPAPKGGVYELKKGEQRCYVGHSCDLDRRQGEHGRDPRMGGTEFKVKARTDSYEERRGYEQKVYDEVKAQTGAPPPLNRQRPVSLKNKKREKYEAAAGELQQRLDAAKAKRGD